MSKSKKQLIREALASQISAITSTPVFSNRVDSFFTGELPAISIITEEETLQIRDIQASSYLRELNITVQVHAEAVSGLDNFLDLQIESIEDAIRNDVSLNGEVLGLELLSNNVVLDGSGSTTIVGIADIKLKVKYTN
jgi:hypothetical protein